MSMNWKKVAGASLMAVTIVGCGEPQERELQDVDHATVHQRVTMNVTGAIDRIADGLLMLESGDLFGMAYDSYEGDVYCEETEPMPGDDGGWSEEDDYGCASGGGVPSEEVEEVRAELIEVLENRIFTEENIELEGGDHVVYLLRGDVMCESEDFYEVENYESCIADVDAMEVRLRASTYSSNSISIDLLLGPDQIRPATFKFSPSEVSVLMILDNMEDASGHISDVLEEDMGGFPETLKGSVRLGYYDQGSQMKVGVDIVSAVEIESEQFNLKLASANDAMALTLNEAAQTVGMMLGFGSISAGGEWQRDQHPEPIEVDEFGEPVDSGDPEPVEELDPLQMALEMAALTGDAALYLEEERVSVNNISIGNGPALFSINGEEVVEVDLNAGYGRSFGAELNLIGDDVEISVSPAVDLRVVLAFHKVIDVLQDELDEWMLDDVLQATLDGDASPALLVGNGLEVLRGQLRFQSQAAGVDTVLEAGMCLDESYEEGSYDPDAPVEEVHPFTEIGAVQCQ